MIGQRWMLGFCVLICALSACGFSERTPQPSLLGSSWQLIELNGQPVAVTRRPLTITFDRPDRLSGFAGCNTFSAGYQIDRATLQVSNVMTTLMACADQTVMDQEQQFHAALNAITRYELNNDRLALLNEQGDVVLRFQAAQP